MDMAQDKKSSSVRNGKIGSNAAAAESVVSDEDFGIEEEDVQAREYASERTLRDDPGKGVERSGAGLRTSGVGGNESGRGCSSGGDIDAGDDALIGIGDPHLHPPQSTPSGEATDDEQRNLDQPVIPRQPTRGGARDNDSSTSAADVNNEVHQDDSFKGDVTTDEATGSA